MTAPFVLEDLDADLEDQLVFEPGLQSLLQPHVPFVIDMPLGYIPPVRFIAAVPINSNTFRIFFSQQPAFRGRQSLISASNPENYSVDDDLGLVLGVGLVENPQEQPDAFSAYPLAYSVDIRLNRHIKSDRIYTVTISPSIRSRDRSVSLTPAPFNEISVRGILKPSFSGRDSSAHTSRR